MTFQQNFLKQKEDELKILKAEKALLAAKATAVEKKVEEFGIRQEIVQIKDETNFEDASGILKERCQIADENREDRVAALDRFKRTLTETGKMTKEEFKEFMILTKAARDARQHHANALKTGY